MKILLLQPNYDAHVIHPPLGLGYLAAYLRKKGHEVGLFDGTLRKATIEDFVAAISGFKPELVGLSVLTRGHFQVKAIIEAIKKKYPKLPVVVGGTQVTASPKEVVGDLGANFGVIGEGEVTLAELVESLADKKKRFDKILGLAYRKRGKIIVNDRRPLIKDLDQLPFPAWDLMPPSVYRIVPILEPARASPIAPIFASRGCPYNCSFCASNVTWRQKTRYRSVDNIIKEIKYLKSEYGVKEIHFADDNLTTDPRRTEAICRALINEKINLPWQCPSGVRVDSLTPRLLRIMRKAGCYALGLGIESGNQEILNRAEKKLNLSVIPGVLAAMKKVGIESYGFFILGLPGETKETIEETINFALKNPFDNVWFNLLSPYPGSPLFNEWLGERDFANIDWERHDCSTAVVGVNGLSLPELENMQRMAMIKFYLRPKIFWKLMKRLSYKELITLLMSRFLANFFKPVSILRRVFLRINIILAD